MNPGSKLRIFKIKNRKRTKWIFGIKATLRNGDLKMFTSTLNGHADGG